MPRVNIISSNFQTRTNLIPEEYNSQTIINDNIQSRLMTISSTNNRYSLENELNNGSERLTIEYNLEKNQNNMINLNSINISENKIDNSIIIDQIFNQGQLQENNFSLINDDSFNNTNLNSHNDEISNESYNEELNNINYILNVNEISQEKKIEFLNDYLNQLGNSQNTCQNQNFQESLIISSHKNYKENDFFNSNTINHNINYYIENKSNNNNYKRNSIIKDFGVLSRPGNDEKGIPKINQDSFISETNINGIKDFNIFGVLDGHGPHGHFISEFASHFIPNQIMNHPEIKMTKNLDFIYNTLKKNNYLIIKKAFISANNLAIQNFDAKISGTTCVLIILIGKHLICANVGDSRAVISYDEQNDNNLNFLQILPLSIDYKPEVPEEKARILIAGGMVERFKDNLGLGDGPYRVFVPGKNFPGLAISRSIGDLMGKKLGVIAEPGIKEFTIGKNTKFVILCSDGVWEFLNNINVRDIGKQFYLNSNASELCQEIINRSLIEWQANDEYTDDITALAVFF